MPLSRGVTKKSFIDISHVQKRESFAFKYLLIYTLNIPFISEIQFELNMLKTSPLINQQESSHVYVKKIVSDCKTQVRLLGLGIGIGSNLQILRNRGGDMVLANNNSRISLGRSIAEKILVSKEH